MKPGPLIRKARFARGISQAKLARLLGFSSAQSISNIERGRSPLPLKIMRHICNILYIPHSTMIKAILDSEREHIHTVLKKTKDMKNEKS